MLHVLHTENRRNVYNVYVLHAILRKSLKNIISKSLMKKSYLKSHSLFVLISIYIERKRVTTLYKGIFMQLKFLFSIFSKVSTQSTPLTHELVVNHSI